MLTQVPSPTQRCYNVTCGGELKINDQIRHLSSGVRVPFLGRIPSPGGPIREAPDNGAPMTGGLGVT